jgi:hypothetical protein
MRSPRRSLWLWTTTPLDGDDTPVLEQVAYDLIGQFGVNAAPYARDQAEIAAGIGAAFTAEIWHDIADTIDRLL